MPSMLRRLAQIVAAVVATVLLIGQPAGASERTSTQPTVAAQAGGGGWWGGPGGDTDAGGSEGEGEGAGSGHAKKDKAWGNDKPGKWSELAGFAANSGGEGFWVLTKGGQVYALQGAPELGSPPADRDYVAMAGHPTRSGFWVLDTSGRVSAFGAATDRGSAGFKRAVGIAVHRTGNGYWIASRRGKVAAFGNAKRYGDLRRSSAEVDRITSREDADGYYLRTTSGRWISFPKQGPRVDGGRRSGEKADDDRTHKRRDDKDQRRREERQRADTDTDPTPSTSGGIRLETVRGITVARKIADNLRALLRAADRDGADLGGWGYRSTARQIELRRAHCGTTRYAIYEMPSSQCSPPTARPGSSMHEKGLAVDFYKKGRNGQAMSIGGTREFRWLKRKAARFGFYNLPSEPWHWSTNGH